jgi:hypothetical protein
MSIARRSTVLQQRAWSKAARGALLLGALIAISIAINGAIILLSLNNH